VASDQAELERALEAERRARIEAEETVKAREEVMAVVAHDLRNPLGVVGMAAAKLLVADAAKTPERVRAAAERIQRQTERMARLVTDLADFTSIRAGKLVLVREPHAASAIIDAALAMAASIATDRGIEVLREVEPGLPELECDRDRLAQTLCHLISNAVQASQPGHPVVVSARRADDAIVFAVRDEGMGIDAAELESVFVRRPRRDNTSFKGPGLGLSIVKGIVLAHGGRVWVDSKVGKGSTFYLSLPLRAA
jgi:two-component system, chemotaxis family, sensor kinase Cph1